MRKIVILGAGVSGLSLGWYLRDRNPILLEKSGRPGGWLQTDQQEEFLFEKGPRSLRPHGAGVASLELVEALGLQNEVITGSPHARKRYLWKNQRLKAATALSLLTSPAVWKGLIQDAFTKKCPLDDESIYDFFTRRMGKEIATQWMDPLVSGIYAGDIRQLSIRSCFPKFWDLEQEKGSLIRGLFSKKKSESLSPFIQKIQKHPLYTFRRGMGTVTKTLAERLSSHIRYKTQARSLSFYEDHVEITLSDGEKLRAEQLFSTLPADALADLVTGDLSRELSELQTTSVAVVNLGYRQKVLSQEGFGYLIPSSEQEDILGVVFDSSAFPEQNLSEKQTRLTVMIGGSHSKQFTSYTENGLLAIAERALKKHLGIRAKADAASVTIAQRAIPQYQVGHWQKLQRIESLLPKRLSLLGTSFYGVAVNDCIAKAKETAEKWNAYEDSLSCSTTHSTTV